MLDLVGEANSQYGGIFSVKCKECQQETKNEFISDPAVYRFQATCQNDTCKNSGQPQEFRLNTPHWTGRP